MHVDHIIPEHLLDDPESLKLILANLKLAASFDLNSYENWLPACGPCNTSKSTYVFEPAPLILTQLARAKKKATKARRIESKTVSDHAIGNSLAHVERAAFFGQLRADQLQPLFKMFLAAHPEAMRAMLREQDEQRAAGSPLKFEDLSTNAVLELRLTPFATAYYRSAGQPGAVTINLSHS
jgi:hypothetical protein